MSSSGKVRATKEFGLKLALVGAVLLDYRGRPRPPGDYRKVFLVALLARLARLERLPCLVVREVFLFAACAGTEIAPRTSDNPSASVMIFFISELLP